MAQVESVRMESRLVKMIMLSMISFAIALSFQPAWCLKLDHVNNRPSTGENHPSISEEKFASERIYVEIDNGPTVGIEMNLNNDVMDLQLEIALAEKLFWGRQQLKLDGVSLRPYTKLVDYRIRPGATLTLSMNSVADGALPIEFEAPTGETVSLVVTKQSSVASVKETIEKLTGLPKAQLRLLSRATELQDSRPVIDYVFDSVNSFRIGEPLSLYRNEVEISVETLSCSRAPIRISPAETVADLKAKIEAMTGVPRDTQHLGFNRSNLYDSDHLCDHGIRAGSRLQLILYRKRVQGPNDVQEFAETISRNRSPRAPIFREAADSELPVPAARTTLYGDARNWAFGPPNFHMIDRWINPAAYAFEHTVQEIIDADRLRFGDQPADMSVVVRACNLMANILKPRWTQEDIYRSRVERPGIKVGTSWRTGELLDENLNNYAPDAFSDADISKLFKLSERARNQLEHDSRTGEGHLGLAAQRMINRLLYGLYRDAIAGLPLVDENGQPTPGDECGICHDDLDTDSSVLLPCKHSLHMVCALSWAQQIYHQSDVLVPMCPFCRKLYRIPIAKTNPDW